MPEPLRLGTLISKLEKEPQDNYLRYDFWSFVPDPSEIGSYRGYYSDLALGYQEYVDVYVKDVLASLKEALGKTYQGYKGGEFLMDEDTPVWVGTYGHAWDTGIVDVVRDGVITVLATAYCVRW